jgi:sugar diacid utilization regulator
MASTSLHIAMADSRQSGRSALIALGDESFEARACAIMGGHHVLGGLVAISRSPMDEVAVRTLERGALVLAVILLAARTPAGHHHGTDDTWFREILNPVCNSPRQLELAAKARGFNADQAWTLALFRPTSAASTPQVIATLRRLRSRSKQASMLLTELDGEFAVLLPTADACSLYAESKAQLTESTDLQVRAVISAPCNHLSEVAASLSGLRSCLDLLDASEASSGVFSADEMIPFAAAFEGGSSPNGLRVRSFIAAAIGPLLEHDRQRHAAVASSVLSFFDHGCNITSSAAHLGIHVNTLKNHLGIARTLVGSWDKAGRGLTIHLALRMARLRGQF